MTKCDRGRGSKLAKTLRDVLYGRPLCPCCTFCGLLKVPYGVCLAPSSLTALRDYLLSMPTETLNILSVNTVDQLFDLYASDRMLPRQKLKVESVRRQCGLIKSVTSRVVVLKDASIGPNTHLSWIMLLHRLYHNKE